LFSHWNAGLLEYWEDKLNVNIRGRKEKITEF